MSDPKYISIAKFARGNKKVLRKVYDWIYKGKLKKGSDFTQVEETRVVYKVREDLEI